MVQKLDVREICNGCAYRSNCISLKNSKKQRKPVLHCEEFDDSTSNKEYESRFLLNSSATIACFSVKNLIPGSESKKT